MNQEKSCKNHGSDNELLHQIARYLMLHASFTNNIGLLNGKTGITIFFYHYAKYTKKRIYDDFARELIDEIYKEIHVNTPLNFKDGLCGIAWGIGYLIQNGFIKADPDEVLEDLDKRIIEWNVRHITDCSLETGLTGIASYVISRMANRKKEHAIIHLDYICDLIEVLKIKKEDINLVLIEKLENIANGKVSSQLWNPIFEITDKIKYNVKKIFETRRTLGIDKAGYVGIGLHLMEINKQ